jgi:phage terminase large subunit-like protein
MIGGVSAEDEALTASIRDLAGCGDLRETELCLRRLSEPQLRTLAEHWPAWAHRGQLPPPGGWRVWLMMAGRGFGKTRAGAEAVSDAARANGSLRIALVAATPAEAERVMVRGESGLLAVARTNEDVLWYPSRGLVEFASGAQAFVYSGANPEGLRGPQHHLAWCDEIAKWTHPEETWANLVMGLRLAEGARIIVTTTPRPIALLKRLTGEGPTAVTRGRTADNLNLPADFVADLEERYGGTRLGRQELDGELIEDVEGSLWPRKLIERWRAPVIARSEATKRSTGGGAGLLRSARNDGLRRVVIGVDPPASSSGDACGIVAAGLGGDGVGYVLGDHSVRGMGPEGWAAAVAHAAEVHGADRVVVESNQGGEMVESVLRGADVALPVTPVFARFGKGKRAEPVAILFERGKAKFAGTFPELEDELAGLTIAGGYEGV